MDPLLFGIKGDVVLEVLGTIVLLSLFVERALSPIFESRLVLDKMKNKGFKEPIVIITSLVIVYLYQFDAMAVIFSQEKNTLVGYLITAGVVSGGSKGSIKLFRDFLNWKSSAQQEHEDFSKAEREIKSAKMKLDLEKTI
ncbi:MAG: hypothetical protein M0P64_02930 [Candidatus Pacebacteria bacterium]|jgi:hypothetical protein|nr:hypothetical protein [Candidatus Paceibacterota bacterium]